MNKAQKNSKNLTPYHPPQSMQNIELQTIEVEYPNKTVIGSYAVLGTLVGGGVTGVFAGLIVIFRTLWTGEGAMYLVSSLFQVVPIVVLLAMIAGFIPALVTGIVLAWNKVVISHYRDYIKVAVCGLVISTGLDFFLLLVGLFFGMVAVREFIICIPIALVGAISAVIVGKWVLPKA